MNFCWRSTLSRRPSCGSWHAPNRPVTAISVTVRLLRQFILPIFAVSCRDVSNVLNSWDIRCSLTTIRPLSSTTRTNGITVRRRQLHRTWYDINHRRRWDGMRWLTSLQLSGPSVLPVFQSTKTGRQQTAEAARTQTTASLARRTVRSWTSLGRHSYVTIDCDDHHRPDTDHVYQRRTGHSVRNNGRDGLPCGVSSTGAELEQDDQKTSDEIQRVDNSEDL